MIHNCSRKTFFAGKNNITEWYCLYLPRSWFYYSCTQKDLFSHQLEGWLSWGLFWTLTAYAYLPHYWQGWFLSGSFTLKEFTNHGEVGRMLRLLGKWFQASQSCSLGYSIIVLARMRKFMPSEKIREIWQPNHISQAASQYLVWWINNLYDSY